MKPTPKVGERWEHAVQGPVTIVKEYLHNESVCELPNGQRRLLRHELMVRQLPWITDSKSQISQQ